MVAELEQAEFHLNEASKAIEAGVEDEQWERHLDLAEAILKSLVEPPTAAKVEPPAESRLKVVAAA